MTADHNMIVPLTAISLIAATSRMICGESVYHILSRNYLPRAAPPAAPYDSPDATGAPRGRAAPRYDRRAKDRAELCSFFLRHHGMEEREVRELAAILVAEHGHRAVEVAAQRQAQYADRPRSEIFRLWNAIAAATAQLLQRRNRARRAG
jgi:hypothetical protein